jgi:hypothetical protein
MKNFLSLKRFRKSNKKAKTIIVKAGFLKGHEVYPVRRFRGYIDENSPFLVKKMEDAIRSLQECPIPEEVFKRAQGIK